MKKFDLIVPYHNSEKTDRREYLDALLKSIPDVKELSIILIDDHSTLPYIPQVEFYKACVVHSSNPAGSRFAGAARNSGVKLATGDYVFFADSDDQFIKESLYSSMIELSKFNNCDVVVAKATSFKDDGSIGIRHFDINKSVADFQNSLSPDALVRFQPPYCKFIRRDFIIDNELKFGDSRVANDVLFAVHLAASRPQTKIIDQTIYKIRQGNSSLTSNLTSESARMRIRVSRQAQQLLAAKGRPELIQPMAYMLLRYMRRYPVMASHEILISLLRRDRILPKIGTILAKIARIAKLSRIIDQLRGK